MDRRRMRARWLGIVLACALVLSIVLAPTFTFARAGGGHVGGGSSGGGFSGGSSSSGHSSSSSGWSSSSGSGSSGCEDSSISSEKKPSGDGAVAAGGAAIAGGASGAGTAGSLPASGSVDGTSTASGETEATFFDGVIGVGCLCCLPLIVVLAIIGAIVTARKRRSAGEPGGVGGTSGGSGSGGGGYDGVTSDKVAPPQISGDPFAEIKAADPNFNDQMFYGRVNEMFVAIQYAWMNRNMEPVRRFLSDQQFSVLDNSIKTDYLAKGQINKLDNVHITQMWPVEVTKMGDYDSVKMLIEAACIDYTVDERTGQLVNPGELGDGKTPTTFQEYWTFMRKSGVASKMDSSIQKCPNCGGPVTDGNYVKCAYCGVQLNDPTLDWVLMRIEQV